jgi:hypothetical protein
VKKRFNHKIQIYSQLARSRLEGKENNGTS